MEFEYNDLGQRAQLSLPNGMVTDYSYDGGHRMTKLEHKDGATVKACPPDNSFDVSRGRETSDEAAHLGKCAGWEYALGDDGNILRMASAVSGSDQAWDYGYDGRSRLVDAVQIEMDGDAVDVWWAEEGETLERVLTTTSAGILSGGGFGFATGEDTDGRFDDIVFTVPDPELVTYEYNDANELTAMTTDGMATTYTYDNWGRTITKAQGAYLAEYAYRYGDKLKSVDTTIPGETDVTYLYDGFGKRRYKGVDPDGANDITWYRWGTGWNVLAEYANDAGAFWDIGAREMSYSYLGMTPLAQVSTANPSTGTYQYYTHDHLGSTRNLWDGSKDILSAIEHLPYGAFHTTAGGNPTYTFTGKPWESEIGQYYFPYRYYSPDAGRWLTRDPLGMVDGPNLYVYVRGSAVNYSDPLGQSAWGVAACAGGLGACMAGIIAGSTTTIGSGGGFTPIVIASGAALAGICLAALKACGDLCPPPDTGPYRDPGNDWMDSGFGLPPWH